MNWLEYFLKVLKIRNGQCFFKKHFWVFNFNEYSWTNFHCFGLVCDTHASSVARDEDHCLELLTFQEARFQWNFSFELIHCVRRRPRPTICLSILFIFLSQLLFGRIVMMLYVRRQSGKFFWRCNGNFMVRGKEMIGNRSADSLGWRGHFCLFVALGFVPLLMTKAV